MGKTEMPSMHGGVPTIVRATWSRSCESAENKCGHLTGSSPAFAPVCPQI
jgi:hypothetical protein